MRPTRWRVLKLQQYQHDAPASDSFRCSKLTRLRVLLVFPKRFAFLDLRLFCCVEREARWVASEPLHGHTGFPARNSLVQSHLSRFIPDYFTMRGRRHGESLFDWGIVQGLWFRQVTHDVKLTNLQNLPPRLENRFKGHTRRLSS